MRKLMLLMVSAVLLSGCGGGGQSAEEEACRDFADAFADLCERCDPGTYYDCYNSIVDLVGGDCGDVQEIRDMDEFYNECIPWLRAEDCANIDENWELDSSCVSQLLI